MDKINFYMQDNGVIRDGETRKCIAVWDKSDGSLCVGGMTHDVFIDNEEDVMDFVAATYYGR